MKYEVHFSRLGLVTHRYIVEADSPPIVGEPLDPEHVIDHDSEEPVACEFLDTVEDITFVQSLEMVLEPGPVFIGTPEDRSDVIAELGL